MLGATKGSIFPERCNYDSRMVEIEVTGLCRQEIIRASNYRVKVPYSRLSQKMQEITRMGGLIKGVRMLSSEIAGSQPSAEPLWSGPVSSETEVLETTEGSQTEGSIAGSQPSAEPLWSGPVSSETEVLETTEVSETEVSETEVSETEVSETEVLETEVSETSTTKASNDTILAEMTEVKPVRSKRKSVEAKKKSTTKTSKSKKLKRKPKSQK